MFNYSWKEKYTTLILISTIIFFLTFQFWVFHEKFKIYDKWNVALGELKKGNYKVYNKFSKQNFLSLKNNGYFLGFYGKSLLEVHQYKKSIYFFKLALLRIPSSKLCIDLGKSFHSTGEYDKAEFYWNKADNMTPSRFTPKYLIAKMYFDIGEKEKAKKIAQDLLKNKKIKIYSIEVHEIVEELKKIGENHH